MRHTVRRPLHGREEREGAERGHEPLRRHGEDEVEVDLRVRPVECEGHEEAKDRPGGAHHQRRPRERVEEHGEQSPAEPGHKVEAEEETAAPLPFERRAEEEEGEHVHEHVHEAAVHEHVGDEGPRAREEAGHGEAEPVDRRDGHEPHRHGEEDDEVRDHEPQDPATHRRAVAEADPAAAHAAAAEAAAPERGPSHHPDPASPSCGAPSPISPSPVSPSPWRSMADASRSSRSARSIASRMRRSTSSG